MFPIRTTVCLVWLALPLCSQSLQVQADSIGTGQEGAAVIRLDSPPGKESLALQWEIHVPLALQVEFQKAVPAEAAVAAEKSLTCAALPDRSGATGRYRCILAGGSKPIGNGPIAILKYIPTRGLRPGRYQLNLRSAMSVGEGVKKVTIKDVAATIVVSP